MAREQARLVLILEGGLYRLRWKTLLNQPPHASPNNSPSQPPQPNPHWHFQAPNNLSLLPYKEVVPPISADLHTALLRMTALPIAFSLYTSLLALFLLLLFFLLFDHFRALSRKRSPSARLPPGPNPWPIVGNLPHLGPVPHHALARLARSYGPLMHLRLGYVDVVVASSSSVAAQFLKTHDANFSSRPPNSGAKHIAYDYQDLVFAPYGPRWRLLRKVCSLHLFSTKALEDFRYVREVIAAAIIIIF